MLSDGYARQVVSLARARSVLLRTHDAAVGSYDWAQFTVDVLVESATEVKRHARESQGGTRVYVSGCTAFLNIFYLKNFTDLLQCRPSTRMGPYISLLNGGDLSNAEETAILQRCLMASHICHSAGSKGQGTCCDEEVIDEVKVSRGRSSVGGLITPDNIKGMECGSSNFDVCWVQLSCDAVSSTPTAKAFDGSSAPLDPVISRGSCQSITGLSNDPADNEGSLLSNLCQRLGNVDVNSCEAYDCHTEHIPIRINFDSTPTFHCGDEADACASTPGTGFEQQHTIAGSEGEEADMSVFDVSPERDVLSAGSRVVL